jgi:phosphoglycolate phosphatase
MNFKEIKHIIWDWNGTLVDDAQLCVDIMNTIRSKRSLPPITLALYRDTFDFPVIEYYKRIGFDLEKFPFESLSQEFIENYIAERKNVALQPGAKEALDFFKRRNTPQCILSATQLEALKETLREQSIEPYFKTVLGLDHHYADGKAHLGETWIQMNDLNHKDILFIGDTLHDLHVADNMGIHCLLVARGHHSKERLTNSRAMVVDNLNEMVELFVQ